MDHSVRAKFSGVRLAAVAGRFYPADPKVLRAQVEGFLNEAGLHEEAPSVKAIIAPHAGYMFSGSVAGSAYAALAKDREIVSRIVLIGPAHFVGFEGLALSSCNAFATPLGLVPVDVEAVQLLIREKLASVLDLAFEREHSLEVQLPFLQIILKKFSIIPILAGQASGEQVARVIEALWGGTETRFVISSDLSHFLDWAGANDVDHQTARSIEALQSQAIHSQQACGQVPICGLLQAARAHRLGVKTLDLRNSGDTAGSRDKVVGYGAFAFSDPLMEQGALTENAPANT